MKKKNLFMYDLQIFAEDKEKEDDQTDNSGTDNDSGDGLIDEPKPEKSFTQSQVNKMMAREKNQGRNQILRELGIDSKDDKALENLKALIASQKTEEQLAIERENAAQLAVQEAERKASLAETKVEAMMSGIKPQYVEDAVTLALAKIGEDGDIKSVLAEFKTKYPVWFEESVKEKDDENKIGKKGTGSSVKSNPTNPKSQGLGARLAAQRNVNVNNNKTSFWSN